MAKYDIFISYSRQDKPKIEKVIKPLISNGYSIWIDVDGIESGEAFRRNIVEAIENSSIVLFFSSHASNISKWTTKEISLAVEFSKYIIPIKLDATQYNKNLLFDLIDLDYIDMSANRLMNASIQKLLKTIKSKIGEKDSTNNSSYIGNSISTGVKESFTQSKREPVQFNHKDIKESVLKSFRSRHQAINAILISLALLCLIGICMPPDLGIFWPASILGLVGIFLLFINHEDGIAFIVGAGLLWTLAYAYQMAPDIPVFRYYQESHPLVVFPPIILTILCGLLLFIQKKGVAWRKRCKKMSTIGIVLLTVSIIFWLWTIYFDTVTKLGLPPNLRHYVSRIFG